jgi:hypothetical protein
MRYNSACVPRLVKSLLPGLLLAALLPSASAAQDEPGVHVDPGSPAGKEYEIPLEGARQEATGGRGQESGGGRAGAPLFGAGVSRGGSQQADGGGAGDSVTKAQSEKKADDGGSTGEPSLASAGGGSGDSATAKTGGIALAVLLVGGAIGLLLRRVLRS